MNSSDTSLDTRLNSNFYRQYYIFLEVGYAMISLGMILTVFICVGNLLTIVAVYKTPCLQTIPNMYVVSLAVADFLNGLIIPYYVFKWYPPFEKRLHDSKFLCLIRMVFYLVFALNSVFCIVAISFDRFMFIRYPLRYEALFTFRKAAAVIACLWLLSIVLGGIPLFYNSWRPGMCTYLVVPIKYYVFVLFPVFVTCLALTGTFYGYITCTAFGIRQRDRRRSSIASNIIEPRRSIIEWKTIKMFIVVFGVFFFSWIPSFMSLTVVYLSDELEWFHLGFWTRMYFQYTVLLGFVNSGTNFIIYACKNWQFQSAFQRILRIGPRVRRRERSRSVTINPARVTSVCWKKFPFLKYPSDSISLRPQPRSTSEVIRKYKPHLNEVNG